MERKKDINKYKAVEASDTDIELFKEQHGLKSDIEAYNFLKKQLCEVLGVIP